MESLDFEGEVVRQIGERLRQIRKRAGLSLRRVALRLGQESKGYYTYLQRLEKGRIRRPSINLIAQYLAGCQASFSDIIDILNQAVKLSLKGETAGREVINQETENLPEPLRTEIRQIDERLGERRAEPIAKRVERVKRMTQNRIIRTLLEETLYGIITAPEAKEVEFEKLAGLCQFGRRVFSILKRTRNSPERGKGLIQRERKWAERQNLPESGVTTVLDEVRALYQEMEKQGIFAGQKLPEVLQKPCLPAPVKAEKRLLLEKQEMGFARERKKATAAGAIFVEMNRELKVENMDLKTRRWVMELINQLSSTAIEFDSKPEELERRFSELIAKSPDPQFARQVLLLFQNTYPKYRALAIKEE
ncbi:MAG: transcriptional regulator [candidate division WOR-3 bacterium]